MNQQHFLDIFLKKNKKGKLRNITFRARPKRYEDEKKLQVINCNHCQGPIAEVPRNANVAGGLCHPCIARMSSVNVYLASLQGLHTRRERRAYDRRLARATK